MDYLAPALAAAVALALGWVAGANQHRLYREPEFRENPASGRRGLVLRGAVAITAAIIAALAFRPDHYDFLPALLTAVFGLIFTVLGSTDFERRRIPNMLSYPAMALAAAVCWAWPDRDVLDIAWGLLAALGIGAFFYGFGLVAGRGGVGFGLGDVKLIILIGLLLGWPLVISGVFLGVLLAGIPALVLIVAGRGTQSFAYGPYLAAAAVAVMLFPETFRL